MAIPLVGLAVAQAVWSASAIIVSALWGILGPEQVASPVQSVLLTVLAVVLLVTGALIAVSAEQLAQALGLSLCHEISIGLLGQESDGEDDPPSAPGVGASAASRVLGLLSAATVGLFGGSIQDRGCSVKTSIASAWWVRFSPLFFCRS